MSVLSAAKVLTVRRIRHASVVRWTRSAADWGFAFSFVVIAAVVHAASGTVTYSYDEAGRLKSASYDGNSNTQYALDPAGNRTGVVSTPPSVTGNLQLSAPTYTIAENGGSLIVTVDRMSGSSGAASVNYATANGTATAGSDYTATSGTLNWAAGDAASKTFSIPILDDALQEGSETLTVTLSGASGAALGSTTSATLTITDWEAGSLAISPASYNVTEAATAVTVTVARAGGGDGAVSVNYATSNGTATAGSDYTATSGTLNWASGDTASKSFTVVILDDSMVEPSETINLTLSSAAGGATISGATGTITINDNDTAGDTSTMTIGYYSGYGVTEKGFMSGLGTMVPTTISGGRYYDTLVEWYYAGSPPYVPSSSGTTLTVGGFSSSPGTSWLTSITVGGVAAPGGAPYSFDSATGKATWSWTGYVFNLPTSGTKTVVLMHQ